MHSSQLPLTTFRFGQRDGQTMTAMWAQKQTLPEICSNGKPSQILLNSSLVKESMREEMLQEIVWSIPLDTLYFMLSEACSDIQHYNKLGYWSPYHILL